MRFVYWNSSMLQYRHVGDGHNHPVPSKCRRPSDEVRRYRRIIFCPHRGHCRAFCRGLFRGVGVYVFGIPFCMVWGYKWILVDLFFGW